MKILLGGTQDIGKRKEQQDSFFISAPGFGHTEQTDWSLLVVCDGIGGASFGKEAAQIAVLKNPEVQARWHAFREASEEIGVARGGFLPRVDLLAGAVREKSDPIEGLKVDLLKAGASEDGLKAIDQEIRKIVAEAADFAESAPEPEPGELYTDVLVEQY